MPNYVDITTPIGPGVPYRVGWADCGLFRDFRGSTSGARLSKGQKDYLKNLVDLGPKDLKKCLAKFPYVKCHSGIKV